LPSYLVLYAVQSGQVEMFHYFDIEGILRCDCRE